MELEGRWNSWLRKTSRPSARAISQADRAGKSESDQQKPQFQGDHVLANTDLTKKRARIAQDRDLIQPPRHFDVNESRGSPSSSLKREGSCSQTPPRRPKSNLATKNPLRTFSSHGVSSPPTHNRTQHRTLNPADNDTAEVIKQPETRPISQEQLVAEVKGIYEGLVMVESKCVEVDNAQSSQSDHDVSILNNEQRQALITLHRTLLHEHHDFFLASQHPSASPALRRLASKYAMPARMWRHGIHSFLELLRHRLPASLEHMLTLIYLSYSMMALLYETVPAFEDTWVECLGDLGRYRMAIGDDNIRDREVWTSVSRHWYAKASDKVPDTGRLYHHLAILALPTALQQLYYYTKSLCVAIPFSSARESIMTLFDPVMAPNSRQQSRLAPTELAFIRIHGTMFSKKSPEKLEPLMAEFVNELDNHIARSTRRWLEPGYYIRMSNISAIVGYDNASNPIRRREGSDDPEDHYMTSSKMWSSLQKDREDTLGLSNKTHDIVPRRLGGPDQSYSVPRRASSPVESSLDADTQHPPEGTPIYVPNSSGSYRGPSLQAKGTNRLRLRLRFLMPCLKLFVGLLFGLSTVGSFTTGVWAKTCSETVAQILRVLSTISLGAVFWAYTTQYLLPEKVFKFVNGFLVVGLFYGYVAWMGAGQSRPSIPPAPKEPVLGDYHLWDDINTGGLLSLLAGAINVDSSLIDAFSHALLKQLDRFRHLSFPGHQSGAAPDLENQQAGGGGNETAQGVANPTPNVAD